MKQKRVTKPISALGLLLLTSPHILAENNINHQELEQTGQTILRKKNILYHSVYTTLPAESKVTYGTPLKIEVRYINENPILSIAPHSEFDDLIVRVPLEAIPLEPNRGGGDSIGQ